MKVKTITLVCLTSFVVLTVAFTHNWAKADSKTDSGGSKIGVISIRRVFEDSKKNIEYRVKADAQQNEIINELKKLDAEIKAGQAGLETLKPDSSDYMEQAREVFEKEGKLQAKKKFYEQQLSLKDQRWTEKLYQDILRITTEVAKEKGLDMVLENNEPQFPAPTANELMMLIRTHKVLYSGGCLDISEEVTKKLDAEK